VVVMETVAVLGEKTATPNLYSTAKIW